MGRAPNPIPTYLRHRQSGQARVVVTDHTGVRVDLLLSGAFDSKESLAEYHRVCGLLRANSGRLPPTKGGTLDLSIAEMLQRYMQEHAATYYLDPDTGAPSREQVSIRGAVKPLNRLFGPMPAADFSPLDLRTLREAMVTGAWLNEAERERRQKHRRPENMARNTVNNNIKRIRRVFRWAVEMMLVPAATLTGLQAVAPLKQGRTAARETCDVAPVDPAVVEATLPYLPPVVADMVRVQLLTGARPGELCAMRVRNLDMTGPVWVYRPERHKTAHRGHSRAIAIGPKAQAVLRSYLKPQLDAYLFSPREQADAIKARKRESRQSKVQPSQACRAKATAKRRPGECYKPTSYNHAVRRACKRHGLPHWHVHQLRHAAALLMEREHGLEAARAALGHKTVNMSAHYSGIDLKRAAEVASKIG